MNPLKPLKMVDRLASRAADGVLTGATWAAKKSVKKTTPDFWNAYTGIKPTKGLTATAWAGAGAYTYGSMQMARFQDKPGQISYSAPPQMLADGVAPKTNAPTLGASGSMVFGLNSMRRG